MASEEILSGDIGSGSQLDGHVEVIQFVANVRDYVVLINGDGQHLTLPVNSDDATGGRLWGGNEDGLGADAVHVDELAGSDIEDVDVSEFCDHVSNAVTIADLHRYREILPSLSREINVGLFLREFRLLGIRSKLQDKKLYKKAR